MNDLPPSPKGEIWEIRSIDRVPSKIKSKKMATQLLKTTPENKDSAQKTPSGDKSKSTETTASTPDSPLAAPLQYWKP
jgi:hypothetical protein